MTDFLIGADPELFVRRDGNLVSAYGLIPGTKEAPHKVNGGAVQVDGMALEFNIDPASTFKEFNENIDSVLSELKKLVGPEYEFDFSPVAEFGKEYIDAQPDKAKELGCDPDYNAYTGEVNPKPNGDLGIRTASGHIHIGWTKDQDITDMDHIEACQMLTKQLDASVGIAARVWDKDTVRTKMYGDLGAYRPKSYGVEYRTPSNVWVNDVRTRRLVFELGMSAASKLLEGVRFYDAFNPKNVIRHNGNDLFANVDYYMAHYGNLKGNLRSDLRDIFHGIPAKVKKPKVQIVPDEVIEQVVNHDAVLAEWRRVGMEMLERQQAAPRAPADQALADLRRPGWRLAAEAAPGAGVAAARRDMNFAVAFDDVEEL